MRKFVTTAALIGLLGILPANAAADPVQVTGGFFRVDFEGDIMSFLAPDFFLGHWFVSGVEGDPNLGLFIPKIGVSSSCYQPGLDEVCSPGETINPSFRTPGEEYLGVGRADIGGTTYTDVTFRGTLDFSAQPVELPQPGPEDSFLVNTPFAFHGLVRGLRNGSELFNVSLAGTGHSTFTLFRAGDRFLGEESGASFVFEESAVATPEPGSMLLFLSGMAGVWARRRMKD